MVDVSQRNVTFCRCYETRQPVAESSLIFDEVMTSQQLYVNRHLTVEEFVGKFRKARLNRILPSEALKMTVEEALSRKIVSQKNVRKLLDAVFALFVNKAEIDRR